MTIDLDAIRQRAEAATDGPWTYNSYSAIVAASLADAHEAFWTEERLNDGHSYEHRYGTECAACGDRPVLDPSGKRIGTYWGCARSTEAYYVEPVVAWVPAHHGDTAIGFRVADAEFIAHAREDIPALLEEVARLRLAVDLAIGVHDNLRMDTPEEEALRLRVLGRLRLLRSVVEDEEGRR